MTVDRSMICFAPDRGEASSRFGFPSAEDINETLADETLGGEPDDNVETLPGSLMAPPALPVWPRVYPGL